MWERKTKGKRGSNAPVPVLYTLGQPSGAWVLDIAAGRLKIVDNLLCGDCGRTAARGEQEREHNQAKEPLHSRSPSDCKTKTATLVWRSWADAL